MKSQWWYASEQFQGGLSRLRPTTEAGSGDWSFRDAQRLSITMEGAWVRDNLDGFLAGDNDLVITSRHRLGERPIIDKIHFYEQEVPARIWIGSFFHPLIFGSADFRESEAQEITLEVGVHDEDCLSDSEGDALKAVIAAGSLAVAIAFPVFAPFAGLAAGLGTGLMQLVDRANDHDKIVEGRIRLAVNKPQGQGWDLLQPGFLVCFAEELDASALFLGQDKRVYGGAMGRPVIPFEHQSYVVVRVTRDALNTPDWLVDQRAATLLSELEDGKRTGRGDALDFLRKTFEAYSEVKKLERLQELTHKVTLTGPEERRLAELRADPQLASHTNGASTATPGLRTS